MPRIREGSLKNKRINWLQSSTLKIKENLKSNTFKIMFWGQDNRLRIVPKYGLLGDNTPWVSAFVPNYL